MTTPALNVEQNTQAVNVPFKQTHPISEVRAKEDRLKPWVLHSPPVTPVKVDRLKFFLHGYDSALASYLIDGFRFGFRVHFVGERLSYESPNLKSAIDQPDLVKAKLSRECAAGRVAPPCDRSLKLFLQTAKLNPDLLFSRGREERQYIRTKKQNSTSRVCIGLWSAQ